MCTTCEKGKYKSSSADADSCTTCPDDLITFQEGSTSLQDCVPDPGSCSPNAVYVDECVCNSGFFGDGANCQPCSPNTFKRSTANGDEQAMCLKCSETAVHAATTQAGAATNQSFCVCDPGYSGPAGGPCHPSELRLDVTESQPSSLDPAGGQTWVMYAQSNSRDGSFGNVH